MTISRCVVCVCDSRVRKDILSFVTTWMDLEGIALSEMSDRGRQITVWYNFSSVQLLSCVPLFATQWNAARQASLTITNSQSLPKPMSIVSVMPSNHLILWRPLLFLPSIFPSIRVVSNESALRIRWPKYWSFSFLYSPTLTSIHDHWKNHSIN